MYGWGYDTNSGALGTGSTAGTKVYPPTKLDKLGTVQSITSGSFITCLMRKDGAVECWGSGYLGTGYYSKKLTPVPVISGLEIVP